MLASKDTKDNLRYNTEEERYTGKDGRIYFYYAKQKGKVE
jgi:hypothetical protein